MGCGRIPKRKDIRRAAAYDSDLVIRRVPHEYPQVKNGSRIADTYEVGRCLGPDAQPDIGIRADNVIGARR